MNIDPKDDLDRAIDETLASMVQGEPLRVSAASVRQAVGRRPGFALPMWLAAAAVLIVGLAVASRFRVAVPEKPASVAQVTPSSLSSEPRTTPSPADTEPAGRPAHQGVPARLAMATTTEAVYEGLPRLTIKSIDLPEPLTTTRLAGEPIQLQSIDIAPLSISTLSNEQQR